MPPKSPAKKSANDAIFSLELLQAQHGDCLLLHVGTNAAPRHILIDGGPTGTYAQVLKPRLEAIAQKRGLEQLPIDHTVVTHLDDDHINGIAEFMKALDHNTANASCNSFWFNVFGELKGELPAELAQVRDFSSVGKDERQAEAVLASVGQGETVRDLARKLAVRVNGKQPVAGKAIRLLIADDHPVDLDWGEGLSVTLVAPDRKRVRKLYEDWQKKMKTDGKVPTPGELAAYADNSVYNLSSLVCVVKAGSGASARSMLLTGDARGDEVLAGLTLGGFLKNGNAHFDLLKLAHHGSDRNYEASFFEQVSADHYAVSADGRFDNPSSDTLAWIAQSRSEGDQYKVWLTNEHNVREPKYETQLRKQIDEALTQQATLKPHLRFRNPQRLSLVIDLLAPIAF